MANKNIIQSGTFLVEVILNNGEHRKALLTGGLHGQFFQDVSLFRFLKEDNTTAPVDFGADDIEIVILDDDVKYDEKSVIGMTPYRVTLKSDLEIGINCFSIKKSDRWIVGFASWNKILKKTFVSFDAIRQVRKILEGEKIGEPKIPSGLKAGSSTLGVTNTVDEVAFDSPPDFKGSASEGPTDFTVGTTQVKEEDKRFQPLREYIAKHGFIDYRKLGDFLNIDPAGLKRKIRLGDFLIQEKLLSEEQLREALEIQKIDYKRRLGEILLELGYLDEMVLAMALAIQARLAFTLLTKEHIKPEAVKVFTAEMAWEHEAIPMRLSDKNLLLAVADPGLLDVQELSFVMNKNVSLIVTRRQDLLETITHYYGKQDNLGVITESSQEIYLDEHTEDDENVDTLAAKGKEGPIVALVNQIIIDAVEKKASDIHVIPEKKMIRISYRINGTITEKSHLNKNLQSYLIARIKILAGMNIVERRLPQDGRIHGRAHNQTVDIRVSALPAQHGETMVLRLRYPDKELPDLDDIGLSEIDLAKVKQAITRSKGMILVTGPTGSGKSTTLVSFLLAVRDQPDKLHIITAEDPVEMEIAGLTQIPVNSAIGMTFPRILRNILRHDPDVIMIGEIRDQETAKIAVQAALTGHLVFSTLHTNDSLSAVTRLEDMGVEPFMINVAVNIVIAQRLIRTLCDCSELYVPDDEEKKILAAVGRPIEAGVQLRRPRGCEKCDDTGFRGRIMVYELFEIDKDLRGMNLKDSLDSGELRAVLRRKGFVSLIENGLDKVFAGKTSLAEIMRHWEG